MSNPFKTKIQTGPQPLSKDERNKIYFEVMLALMNLQIWDLNDESMQKFRIMMKLYLDHGKEFSGELEIESIERKLIYNLYNDRRKKTVAYLSGDRYFKAIKAREKQQEREAIKSNKQMINLPVDPVELKALREKEASSQNKLINQEN